MNGRGKIRIAIVDDYRDLADSLQEYLMNVFLGKGIKGEVSTFGSGHEVLRWPGLEETDLFIIDFNMPKMAGDEVARLVRSKNPTVKIIGYSGIGRNPFGDTVDRFIAKDASPQELTSSVFELLGLPE